jgi:gamma-glutamylcyclotransferase (GGCT)/AIG2-like uncharacterized protein YtfP
MFQEHPFFVYGTLLPGQPNYYVWGNHIRSEQTAVFHNGRLYDLGYYPLLVEVEEANEPVQGMLINVKSATFLEMIVRLDHLEGFDPSNTEESEYLRVAREVEASSGTAVTAWLYLGQVNFTSSLPHIPSGSWVSHIQHRQQQIDNWWQQIHSASGLHDDLSS